MQLVRTAQPKHKINLLSLSTEAGGPDVGHLVCSINSMQFVRTAQFKHKHLLALYSHSPRRTGGPQAPASGALVYIYIYIWRSLRRVRRHRASIPQSSSSKTGAALTWQVTMDQLIMRLSFSAPTIGNMKWASC